jgi:hypothetical protein
VNEDWLLRCRFKASLLPGALAGELYKGSYHLLPKCTQCAIIQIDETYKLEYAKEPETERTEGDLF